MEKEIFEKYLKERYFDQMNYYDRKSGFYQERYKKFQWILIILSALTPIVAALQGSTLFGEGLLKVFGDNLQIIVVIISAIVAILTTGLKTFQYQELWITYRLTQEQLKPEIYYYQFNVGPYGETGVDKESLFVSRIESILDKEHSTWPPAKKLNDNDGKGEQVVVDPNAINPGTTTTVSATVSTTETTTTTPATEAAPAVSDQSAAAPSTDATGGDASAANAGEKPEGGTASDTGETPTDTQTAK